MFLTLLNVTHINKLLSSIDFWEVINYNAQCIFTNHFTEVRFIW